MKGSAAFTVAVGSTIGLKAVENQDSIGLDGWVIRTDTTSVLQVELDASKPHVLVIADGMGGVAGGRRASEIAAERISQVSGTGTSASTSIAVAIDESRALMDAIAVSDPALAQLGTTVVAFSWNPGGDVVVSQLGDSMAYRFYEGYLGALGEPHREPEGPFAGQLTHFIGAGQKFRSTPESLPLRAHDGVRYVLCTDGVWDVATQATGGFEQLQAALEIVDPRAAVEAVLSLATSLGAPDNATVAIVTFGAVDPTDSE